MTSIFGSHSPFIAGYLLQVCSSLRPSLIVRNKLRMLGDHIPELNKAIGCTQNHHHIHDVFDHTMAVLDATPARKNVRLAALFHDLGKVHIRVEQEDGRITFHGHEDISSRLVNKHLDGYVHDEDLERIAWLCAHHMDLKAAGADGQGLSDRALQKLKAKAPDTQTFEDLLDLCHADNVSHAPASCMPEQIGALRERFATIGDFVPRNVHAKPIQAMFDYYIASHDAIQLRVSLRYSKAMLSQAVDQMVDRLVDFFSLENDVHIIPPDKHADYRKAFRSRAEAYVPDYLRRDPPHSK